MSHYHLEIRIIPRPGVLDPQGKAIHHALHELGYDGTEEVRVGKAINVELEAGSEAEARETVDEMCRKLLANPVTEEYEISLVQATGSEAAP
jgi:phosphoribosylformylglycinamidine synthase